MWGHYPSIHPKICAWLSPEWANRTVPLGNRCRVFSLEVSHTPELLNSIALCPPSDARVIEALLPMGRTHRDYHKRCDTHVRAMDRSGRARTALTSPMEMLGNLLRFWYSRPSSCRTYTRRIIDSAKKLQPRANRLVGHESFDGTP